MKTHNKTGALGMALLLGFAITPKGQAASNVKFRTVVNNGMTMPDSENTFNAYKPALCEQKRASSDPCSEQRR
jgi:hypothetical protein